jgi:hypothetical protein
MLPTELELDLGTATLHCPAAEVSTALLSLLEEARAFARNLRPGERALVRRIMAHRGELLAVRGVFPGFARESRGHRTLRRLRAAMLVRPGGGGCWLPKSRIEVRLFGRLVWDQPGEAEFFPDVARAPSPDATRNQLDWGDGSVE